MSVVPEHLKQDMEFMHQIVRAQKLGQFSLVNAPLPEVVTYRDCGFNAYHEAFLGWLGVTLSARPIDSVQKELKYKFPFIIEETRDLIADAAKFDLDEIDNIEAAMSTWDLTLKLNSQEC